MKIAVTYYSRTGNTKRLAEAMADAVGCTAQHISSFNGSETLDLLFIGGSIYGGKLDISLQQFIDSLDSEKIKRAIVFSTFAFSETANAKTKELLKEHGVQIDERCFTCKGKFLFFNRKHPNKLDLNKAKEFVYSIINESH